MIYPILIDDITSVFVINNLYNNLVFKRAKPEPRSFIMKNANEYLKGSQFEISTLQTCRQAGNIDSLS